MKDGVCLCPLLGLSQRTVHVYMLSLDVSAEVAQWVRAFAPQAEGRVFEFQPRQTQVAKTGSDSSTTQTLNIRCECHGSAEMTIKEGYS